MSVTVGVIGCGDISRFHFEAFEQTGTKVAVIADVDADRARPWCEKFKAEYTRDHDAVLSHPDVQAVVVLVPSSYHYSITKAALEAGKHVVCEKTLTLSAQESYDLARLAEQKDLLLFTSYMKRFFPAAQTAKALMPKLGHIMSVYCRTYQGVGGVDMHTGKPPGAFMPGPDGVSPVMKKAGGGVLICGGSHIVDLLMFLVGKPTSVFASKFQREGCDVDFMTHALMTLPEGGSVHFEANWHPLKKVGFESRGWDESFEISGVGGRIVLQTPVWNEPQHNAARLRHYDNESETWTDYEFSIVSPFAQAEKHFLAQIEKGEQGPQDRYTGYRADYLLEQIAKSANEGAPVKLEWRA